MVDPCKKAYHIFISPACQCFRCFLVVKFVLFFRPCNYAWRPSTEISSGHMAFRDQLTELRSKTQCSKARDVANLSFNHP